MGSEGHKDEGKDEEYEDEYAERDKNTCEPNTDNEPEHNNNEISIIMDKQYVTGSRENMQARKRKCDLPPTIRIHPTTNNEVERSKIHHSNMMVQTMGNTYLDMRDYARLHSTIHCGPNLKHNVMSNTLVTTVLTQYHVSKGLKVFGDTSVEAVLK